MSSDFLIPATIRYAAASATTAARLWALPFLLIAALALPLCAVAADSHDHGDGDGSEGRDPLPELGDSAGRVLTPVQEERIGQQFLRALLRDNGYVGDAELNAYINHLGDRVARHASLRGMPISVHLYENPQLNAFAVPGGHITFHTGLITATEDENELAAVMAHEISHISQRHLPRMLAKAQASTLPAAAAILASVLVGGQTGLAGLTVANAALVSNQLAYTREFEREADAIGIQLAVRAGFDPSAMGRFFNKLDRRSEEGPEYLRTHPLSYTRIAEAENRAATYSTRDYPSSRAYHLAKAKIRALHSPRNHDVIAHFREQGESESEDERIAATYGLALAQRQRRQFDQAGATLQPLLDSYPNEPAFQLAQAEIDRISGKPALAVARYARLVEARPELIWLTYYQVEALIANGEAAAAKRVIRHRLRRHKDMFKLYPLLAKSNAKQGLLAESHQAIAEFHAALGEYAQAVSFLKLALRESDSEGYLHESISARLREFEETLKQVRR